MSNDLRWVAVPRPKDLDADFQASLSRGDFPRLTYWPENWKSLSAVGLWDLAMHTLAYSNFYMDFLELRFGEPVDDPWGGQRERVHALCRRLVKEGWEKRFPDTEENRKWFQDLLVEIGDEVENQC